MSMENTYLQMTADITLPKSWKPIGVKKNAALDTIDKGNNLCAFSGIFDGAGHKITVAEGGLPLFGYVRGAEIRNLNIYGSRIAGYGLINNMEGVGLSGRAVLIENVTLLSGSQTKKSGLLGSQITENGFAGCSVAYCSTIRNCTIEKGVIIGYDKNEREIGSIAGRLNGTVENCKSYATVYGSEYVGGLVGTKDNATGTCQITGSEFGGEVIGTGAFVGGIVGGGYNNSTAPNGYLPVILDNKTTGSVTGNTRVGGILGG